MKLIKIIYADGRQETIEADMCAGVDSWFKVAIGGMVKWFPSTSIEKIVETAYVDDGGYILSDTQIDEARSYAKENQTYQNIEEGGQPEDQVLWWLGELADEVRRRRAIERAE